MPQDRPFCPQPTSSTCRHLSPCSLAPCTLLHERAFRQIYPRTPSLQRCGRGRRPKRWRDSQEYVTVAQLKSPEPGMKLTPKPHFGQNTNKDQAAAYLDLEVQLIFVGEDLLLHRHWEQCAAAAVLFAACRALQPTPETSRNWRIPGHVHKFIQNSD